MALKCFIIRALATSKHHRLAPPPPAQGPQPSQAAQRPPRGIVWDETFGLKAKNYETSDNKQWLDLFGHLVSPHTWRKTSRDGRVTLTLYCKEVREGFQRFAFSRELSKHNTQWGSIKSLFHCYEHHICGRCSCDQCNHKIYISLKYIRFYKSQPALLVLS